ncbi:MAG: DUF2807 domain-containing protein [Maribacter sp.]|nr:MAG: DUF2807 domain-containing protein [Maribacter sp.]
MKKATTLSLVVLLTISCSAQWGKKVKGNGNVATMERSTEEYDAIAVSGWFNVDLVPGNEGDISLKGEENLLEYIVTEVKDGKLAIKVREGINLKPSTWKNGILITVPIEDIDAISLSGSGDIVGRTTIVGNDLKTSLSGSGDITLDLETRSTYASMSGSGDIILSGATTDLKVSVSGSGDIKAYDLEAENVDASISGSADIKVTANKSLKARVSGSGDIHYRGNPEKVNTITLGSGDITRA